MRKVGWKKRKCCHLGFLVTQRIMVWRGYESSCNYLSVLLSTSASCPQFVYKDLIELTVYKASDIRPPPERPCWCISTTRCHNWVITKLFCLHMLRVQVALNLCEDQRSFDLALADKTLFHIYIYLSVLKTV